MEFNNLGRQYKRIESEIKDAVERVFKHGQFINGPEVGELERKLAKYIGSKYAVGCASGTDALLLSLMALDIGYGDLVYTSAFSFVSVAEVAKMLGAHPVFVDINPYTFNMDCNDLFRKIEANPLYDRNGVIVPVNLFGLPCEYDVIQQIGNEHNLPIVEDAAQSFGAKYQGFKSGNLGDIGCTSFFPTKPLGCYGDGGMVFTNDNDLYLKLRRLRNHGQVKKYYPRTIGLNSRLDTIQAAVLLEKFKIFEWEMAERFNRAQEYNEHLPQQFVRNIKRESALSQFSILCENEKHRSKIIKKFQDSYIPFQIYYPISLPETKAYRSEICPVAQDVSRRILQLPFSAYITLDEIKMVSKALKEV